MTWFSDEDGAFVELDNCTAQVDDAELAGKSSQLNITCLVGTLVACSEPIMSCHIAKGMSVEIDCLVFLLVTLPFPCILAETAILIAMILAVCVRYYVLLWTELGVDQNAFDPLFLPMPMCTQCFLRCHVSTPSDC
ncbi:Early-responsive to dehydration [Corchorus olitorius]|uniref:Early-responsive to dehydration n=1 Tax=Corchorus olitorius TaxID=93759 RepID=A0A1R3J2E9_9ROSI|nr:Early-responsive to dehydration [Corchorus olitorius]